MVIAITILERRVQTLRGKLFQAIKDGEPFEKSELDNISDTMYDWFKSAKSTPDYSRSAWYRPLMKQYADVTSG